MTGQKTLLDIPEYVLALIASYLPVKDVYNFKKTCSTLNNASYLKDAMKHTKLRIIFDSENKQYYGYGFRKVTVPREFEQLLKFIKKLQFGVSLSICPIKPSVSQETFKELLTYEKDLSELTIAIKDLEIVSLNCPKLEALMLVSNLILPDTFRTFHQGCDTAAFKHLKNLKHLSLSKICLPIGVFGAIVSQIPTLNTLYLTSVVFAQKERWYDDEIPFLDVSIKALQEKVKNASHITNWAFDATEITGINLDLPKTVKVLSVKTGYRDLVVAWSVDCLQTLHYEGKEIPKWNSHQCESLTRMTLVDVNFNANILPVSRSIEYLRLEFTSDTLMFLEKLSITPADQLKYLILRYPQNLSYDARLSKVISSFSSLVYVEITETEYQLEFVEELKKISSLKHIVLVDGYGTRKSFVS